MQGTGQTSRGAHALVPTLANLPPEPDDPQLSVPRGLLTADPAGPLDQRTIDADRAELAAVPGTPLAPPPAHRRGKNWAATLAFSGLLHAVAALAVLAAGADRVMIAGSEDAGVLLLGNADADQAAAGAPFPDSTQVTLVTMVAPQPAQTVTAEAVEPVAAPASTSDGVETPIVADTMPMQSETVEPAATSPESEAVAVQAPEPVEDKPLPAQAADPAPPILAAEVVQPAEDPASALPPAEKTVPEPVEGAKAVATPNPAEPAQEPRAAERKAAEKSRAKAGKAPAPKQERKHPAKKNAPGKKSAETQKPARKGDTKAGSGGNAEADAKRGTTAGEASGTRTVAGKGGTLSAAGNAAVSNYPGKVAARLRRASRGISGSGRSRATNTVRVSFTVTAAGALAGVRIASSSGSPDLDKAALAIVRRAEPFPSIPPEAGRRTWAFTLPLGIR
ncbi:MAG: TonB family protein [Mesorhizobium sp.]|nr:TonB family protein [Mesorhizobium sp.]